MLLLVEQLQEFERLVRVLRLREHGPVLAVERRHADLPGRSARAQHRREVLGVAHVLGRILLDVADGARPREMRHRDLAGGQRGLRVEILLSRPARGLEPVELLQVVEDFEHRLAVQLWPPRLGVDPGAPVGGQPLRGMHEAHVELLAGHLNRVAPVLRERRAELQHVVEGLRRLQALLLAQVAPLAEVRRAHGVRHAVVLAVEVLQLERRLVDVALAERADQFVHRPQEMLHVEGGGHERVEVREVGRAAGGERGQQFGVEIAPAEGLLLDLEAGELALELGDRGLLDGLHRLGLDLGVPDVELAPLLAEGGRRAGKQRGAGGERRGFEEVATGDGRHSRHAPLLQVVPHGAQR